MAVVWRQRAYVDIVLSQSGASNVGSSFAISRLISIVRWRVCSGGGVVSVGNGGDRSSSSSSSVCGVNCAGSRIIVVVVVVVVVKYCL